MSATIPDELILEMDNDLILSDDPADRVKIFTELSRTIKQMYRDIADSINLGLAPGVPVGAMMGWPTDTPPDGWMERDGTAISRDSYADLFAVIGTMYGPGDGSTTFNLPDDRGLFSRYWDHGAGVDPDASSRTDRGDGTTGDQVGTKQADEHRSHAHDTGQFGSYAGMAVGGAATGLLFGFPAINYVGFDGGLENRPTNRAYMPIIKVS